MNRQQLRNDILELETVNPELKEHYQNEIREVIDKPLKPWERILLIVGIPLMLGVLIVSVRLCIFDIPQRSAHVRTEVGIVGVLCVILTIWSALILKKGKDLKNGQILPTVTFCFFVALIGLSLIMTRTVDMTLVAATMIVGIASIGGWIKYAELRIRENILRQELRLTQLAEKLERLE